MTITVIFPAYNEENRISDAIEDVQRAISPDEILVVDDGSSDATVERARNHAGVRVLTTAHRGKAHALIVGMQETITDVLCWCDADMSTPAYAVNRLIGLAEDTAADIVIGSRGTHRHGYGIGRNLLSWGQRTMQKTIFGLPYTDTQCGYKAMTTEAAHVIVKNLKIYTPTSQPDLTRPYVASGFDLEFLLVAQRLGYKIIELEVDWDYRPTRRVRILRDMLLGIDDMVKVYEAHKTQQATGVEAYRTI